MVVPHAACVRSKEFISYHHQWQHIMFHYTTKIFLTHNTSMMQLRFLYKTTHCLWSRLGKFSLPWLMQHQNNLQPSMASNVYPCSVPWAPSLFLFYSPMTSCIIFGPTSSPTSYFFGLDISRTLTMTIKAMFWHQRCSRQSGSYTWCGENYPCHFWIQGSKYCSREIADDSWNFNLDIVSCPYSS